jgi:chromosome segregation and condensation protein ScpB
MENLVDSILFLSSEPLTIEEIAKLSKLTPEKVRQRIEKLRLALSGINSSIQIIEDGEHVFMDSKHRDKFKQLSVDRELSKSSLRILATIVAKGRIKLHELAKLKGPYIYGEVKKLHLLGFVKKWRKDNAFFVEPTDKVKKYFKVKKREGEGE